MVSATPYLRSSHVPQRHRSKRHSTSSNIHSWCDDNEYTPFSRSQSPLRSSSPAASPSTGGSRHSQLGEQNQDHNTERPKMTTRKSRSTDFAPRGRDTKDKDRVVLVEEVRVKRDTNLWHGRRRSHEPAKREKKSDYRNASPPRRTSESTVKSPNVRHSVQPGDRPRSRRDSGAKEATPESLRRRPSSTVEDRRDRTHLRSEKRRISDHGTKVSESRPGPSRYATKKNVLICPDTDSTHRSASAREPSRTPSIRPSLLRSKSTTRKPRPTSHEPPPTSYRAPRTERAASVSSRRSDRPASIYSTLLGSTKSRSKVEPAPKEPEEEVECLACMSSFPASKVAQLPCEHRMCNSCLRRVFNLSLTDPQNMPPKCCTAKPIPLKHVDRLFDYKFKRKWNAKLMEFSTENRIYCPGRRCGTWIKPDDIKKDKHTGRKAAKCGRCRLKICCTCNGKWHTSKVCPKDPETQAFIKHAKEQGWQRCYNCASIIELKEGCNHMTCRCKAEFCMICGSKWKTCDCPWFNYNAVEADRLNHMNVPLLRQVPVGNPGLGYQQEMDRRREQERRDEAFARRMQFLGLDGEEPNFHEQAFGTVADHFMNENFVQRARDILAANFDPAQNEAAERLIAEHRRDHMRHEQYRPRRPGLQRHNVAAGARPQAAAAVPPPPPAPPRARAGATPLRRANTTALVDEPVVPRRSPERDYHADAARYRPLPPNPPSPPRDRGQAGPATASQLAGITRGQTAAGRVDEWRQWVQDAGGVG